MQSLIRSKSAGVTGGRGTAGAGPGRDLLYLRARAEFQYTSFTSHVQGAEAPGTGLTRDMMDLSTAQNRHSESVTPSTAPSTGLIQSMMDSALHRI